MLESLGVVAQIVYTDNSLVYQCNANMYKRPYIISRQ
jgi:hypothetical protein